MMASNRRIGLGAAVLALFIAGSAGAQENLDSGKTPAELYAQDCAICHKSPRGLAQTGGILGVQAFLREHYTASREAAAAIAAYLEQVDRSAPPARPAKRAARPKEKSKIGDGKPAEAAKGTEPKASAPGQAKQSEPPAETATKPDKPAEAKPDTKTDTKSETKSSETKTETKAEADKTPPNTPPKTPPKTPRAVAKPDSDKKSD